MKKNEIAAEALLFLARVGIVSALVVAPGLAHTLKLIDRNPQKAMRKLDRAFQRLVRKGFAVKKGDRSSRTFRLTEKGRRELPRVRFDTYEPIKRQWDGQWRVICFDIPEKRKHLRSRLQYKLRDIGFFRLQDSVFVYPYACDDLLLLVHDAFGLQKEVRLMTVITVDDETVLLRYFKLAR